MNAHKFLLLCVHVNNNIVEWHREIFSRIMFAFPLVKYNVILQFLYNKSVESLFYVSWKWFEYRASKQKVYVTSVIWIVWEVKGLLFIQYLRKLLPSTDIPALASHDWMGIMGFLITGQIAICVYWASSGHGVKMKSTGGLKHCGEWKEHSLYHLFWVVQSGFTYP